MQISLDALQTLISASFDNSKVDPETAQIVAKALVRAEADGISSHGVARVPPYAEQAKCGKVDGFAKPTMTRPRPGVLTVDSHHGLAPPAVAPGRREGTNAALAPGVAAVGVSHSHTTRAPRPLDRAAADAAAKTATETFEQGTASAGLPTVEIPASELAAGMPAYAIFARPGLAASNGEARRLIRGGGGRLNDVALTDENAVVTAADATADGAIKLSAGKKRHVLVRAG